MAINIATIGCGYWGPNLVRNLSEIEGANIAAICDIDKNKLNSLKKSYPNIKIATDNYKDILNNKEIDAVVVATPAITHYKIANECLLAGKHVLVEKPLAHNSKDAEELVKTAKEKKKILMVGHTFEYNPVVAKIKEYIKNGDIGKVYYIDCTRVNLGQIRDDVNVVWNLAPHDISVILYWLEPKEAKVSCKGIAHIRQGIEDVAYLTLELQNSIFVNIHVSWLDPVKTRKMTIVGSKKMILYDDLDSEAKIKIYDKGVDFKADPYAYGAFQLKLRAGDILIPKIESSEPLRNECEHFIECIKKNKTPRTDGLNGLRVVKVLEAAQESLKNNGASIKVNLR